jgi:hypothetical protein
MLKSLGAVPATKLWTNVRSVAPPLVSLTVCAALDVLTDRRPGNTTWRGLATGRRGAGALVGRGVGVWIGRGCGVGVAVGGW